MTKRIALILITVILFSACAAVGPNYVRPDKPVAEKWNASLDNGLRASSVQPQVLASWWTTLADPDLSRLMEKAAAGNLDLKVADARLREARARRGVARAGFYPSVDASASATFTRSDAQDAPARNTRLYSAGFDAGWEFDIFGGVRREVEAADADIDAQSEALNATMVSLLAETALNYVDVRTYQARLASVEANINAQAEIYDLTRQRFQAGLDDELSVQQAAANLESSRAQVPGLEAGLAEAKNRIAVLLGKQPGAVDKELEASKPIPLAPADIAVGVPADVLRQRPDVRRAERQLAAQTARIGVAKADLYPRFRLSGSIGLDALSLTNPVSAATSVLSGGPRIAWRIFDAGAVRRNIEAQTAVQEQYLVAYESAVNSALEEVENSLTAYAKELQRRKSLTAAAESAKQADELARMKYQAGLVDFRYVLDSQRTLISLQDQLAQSAGNVTANLVRLYKSLGGGWTPMTEFSENQK